MWDYKQRFKMYGTIDDYITGLKMKDLLDMHIVINPKRVEHHFCAQKNIYTQISKGVFVQN